MQGLQPSVILASVLVFTASTSQAQFHNEGTEAQQAAVIRPTVASDYRVIDLADAGDISGTPVRIHEPDARYIKVHFSEFNLPAGVVAEVSSPDRKEVYRYSSESKDALTVDASREDDGTNRFSALSVTGDTAIVRLTGVMKSFDPARHRVRIDSYAHSKTGIDSSKTAKGKYGKRAGPNGRIESDCGTQERLDAVCWSDSYPDEYDRSTPVAMVITSRGDECTAWRVGSDNRMFTAQHCISSQDDLSGAEIWFNYESDSCGGPDASNVMKVSGRLLLATNWQLDYTLFSVNDFSSIKRFGNLGLDLRHGDIGENIFIPQHGKGDPKQISIESDMNSSGFCEIDNNQATGYGSRTDIEYFCDTTDSSSGSPVISGITGKVLALHHLGGCENSGAKIALIWPEVAEHFNNVVPEGDGGGSWVAGNEVPDAFFSVACTEMTCRFDASGSTDSDGSITGFAWDFGDGEQATGETVEHLYPNGGEFQVTLAVEDDEGAIGAYSEWVSMEQPNEPPSAVFSAACVENSCTFNGSNSADSDGSIVRWDWNLGDGSYSSGEKVTHDYSEAGSFNVLLEVEDDEGAVNSRFRRITVTLPNETPEASFTVECSEGRCSFDASGSSDPDGEVSDYSWSFGDGGNDQGVRVEHDFSRDGTFTVELAIQDDEGKTATASQAVTVDVPNKLPTAAFKVNCSGLDCQFDAGTSYDLDGSIGQFSWDFGDGTQTAGETTSHSFAEAGKYVVTLAVEDNEGAQDTQTHTVAASLPNRAPQASISFECSDGLCAFDGSSSSDSDGDITAYRWSFGDGRKATGATVEHRFDADGRYTVALTVEDDGGDLDVTSATIEIDLPNSTPSAAITYRCDDRKCSFDAGGSRDKDGRIESYLWSFGDGARSNDRSVTHQYNEDGRFTVILTVKDNEGAQHTSSQTVNVERKREIELDVNGKFQSSRSLALLKWRGAEGNVVLIYRNGELIGNFENNGRFQDMDLDYFSRATNYRVCESDSDLCSPSITIINNS